MKESPDGHRNGARAPREIEITHLTRISERNPTAWEGTTADGSQVHVAYLCGELSISLRMEAADGGRRWCEILCLPVERMEAEIRACQDWQTLRERSPQALAALRQSALRDAERREMAERRRANWPKTVVANGSIRWVKARSVTLQQLRGWLRARQEHLRMLRERGAAGGPLQITLTAIGDGI